MAGRDGTEGSRLAGAVSWAVVSEAVVSAVEPDPDLLIVCGEQPSWFCEGAWNATHNRMLARAADWFVTRPLLTAVVLLVAWLLNRYLRRVVTVFVTRLTTGRQLANEALQKIGVDRPAETMRINSRDRG